MAGERGRGADSWELAAGRLGAGKEAWQGSRFGRTGHGRARLSAAPASKPACCGPALLLLPPLHPATSSALPSGRNRTGPTRCEPSLLLCAAAARLDWCRSLFRPKRGRSWRQPELCRPSVRDSQPERVRFRAERIGRRGTGATPLCVPYQTAIRTLLEGFLTTEQGRRGGLVKLWRLRPRAEEQSRRNASPPRRRSFSTMH